VTHLNELVKRLKGKGMKFVPNEVMEITNEDIPIGEGKINW
jgi:hypothetical protein